MPNQISPDKQFISITLPKKLVAEIDRIAQKNDRSRTYTIAKILEEQLQKSQQITNNPPAGGDRSKYPPGFTPVDEDLSKYPPEFLPGEDEANRAG